MPGSLIRLAGPVASGKSQTAKAMLDADQADVLADTTAIYAALSGDERDSNGRYPSRPDGALLLPLALYVRQTVVREGLRRDLRVLKTSSTKTDLERDHALASELGASFREIVIDPGRMLSVVDCVILKRVRSRQIARAPSRATTVREDGDEKRITSQRQTGRTTRHRRPSRRNNY